MIDLAICLACSTFLFLLTTVMASSDKRRLRKKIVALEAQVASAVRNSDNKETMVQLRDQIMKRLREKHEDLEKRHESAVKALKLHREWLNHAEAEIKDYQRKLSAINAIYNAPMKGGKW